MKRKTDSKGTITSVDGKTTITLEEFDRRAEDGESLSEFFDWSKATRPGALIKPGEMVTIREVDDTTGKVLRVRRYRHGGKRPGAGRKPAGRVQYVTRLRPDVIARVKAEATRQGRSECEVVEDVLAKSLHD